MGLVGTIADEDQILARCIELAAESLTTGDHPFGSVLVAADGRVLAEDRNRENSLSDPTYHPEIMLVRWAVDHLAPEERAEASVYTSGEHCAMCSAAHGWAGLGPIVTIATTDQFAEWRSDAGMAAGAVASLAIRDVAPGVPVKGPVPEYNAAVRELYARYLRTQPS